MLRIFSRATSVAFLLTIAFVVITPRPARAANEKVLYSFTGGADGANPTAALVRDSKGNLYGTTYSGGAHNLGAVFEITSAGKEVVLHSFSGNPDGANPYAGLIMDSNNNLFGTTVNGGGSSNCSNGCGTVFEVTSAGEETVLYSFASYPDGASPYGGLVMDPKNNLYGTTLAGGQNPGNECNANGGCGTIFELTSAGEESVLYEFCQQGGYSCTDGIYPYDALVRDSKGNLYGTTFAVTGGFGGVVFELTSKGQEETLYSFCAQKACADGNNPYASLVDSKGNLYGTTFAGGSTGSYGVVFRVTRKGKESKEKVLYYFPGGEHGANPHGGLIRDAKGNLFGTTYAGGNANNAGIVFEITPNGHENVLYTFCSDKKCADGASPYAGVTEDSKGNFYGTTYSGGAHGYGTVFEVIP
jgi:uncharacterized repeat protein (TIGR03803 family)